MVLRMYTIPGLPHVRGAQPLGRDCKNTVNGPVARDGRLLVLLPDGSHGGGGTRPVTATADRWPPVCAGGVNGVKWHAQAPAHRCVGGCRLYLPSWGLGGVGDPKRTRPMDGYRRRRRLLRQRRRRVWSLRPPPRSIILLLLLLYTLSLRVYALLVTHTHTRLYIINCII